MIIPASQNDYAAGFADGYRRGKKDAERKKGRWIDGQCSICEGSHEKQKVCLSKRNQYYPGEHTEFPICRARAEVDTMF